MDKDTRIIKRIITHIENALNTQKRFGNDFEIFAVDRDYFNSVCMSLLQIGELAHHLTTEFTRTMPIFPGKTSSGFEML